MGGVGSGVARESMSGWTYLGQLSGGLPLCGELGWTCRSTPRILGLGTGKHSEKQKYKLNRVLTSDLVTVSFHCVRPLVEFIFYFRLWNLVDSWTKVIFDVLVMLGRGRGFGRPGRNPYSGRAVNLNNLGIIFRDQHRR